VESSRFSAVGRENGVVWRVRGGRNNGLHGASSVSIVVTLNSTTYRVSPVVCPKCGGTEFRRSWDEQIDYERERAGDNDESVQN
jgi:hypothetical protein